MVADAYIDRAEGAEDWMDVFVASSGDLTGDITLNLQVLLNYFKRV